MAQVFRFKDSRRTSAVLPSLAFIPFKHVYWSIYAVPSDNTSISLIHPISPLLLSHPFICASIHPSLSLSLLSAWKILLLAKPHMRCRQCKSDESYLFRPRDQPSFQGPALLAEAVPSQTRSGARLPMSHFSLS